MLSFISQNDLVKSTIAPHTRTSILKSQKEVNHRRRDKQFFQWQQQKRGGLGVRQQTEAWQPMRMPYMSANKMPIWNASHKAWNDQNWMARQNNVLHRGSSVEHVHRYASLARPTSHSGLVQGHSTQGIFDNPPCLPPILQGAHPAPCEENLANIANFKLSSLVTCD